jgi:hypothetical protein
MIGIMAETDPNTAKQKAKAPVPRTSWIKFPEGGAEGEPATEERWGAKEDVGVIKTPFQTGRGD